MPSTYTSNNKIQKVATGEQSGTWGNTTNTNFDLLDTAIDGFVAVSLTGTTYTLNIPDGSAADGRNKVISFTGTLAAANTVSITPNTVRKHYFVQNNTTGGQNVIIAQGSGSTVTIKPGYSSIVYLDGAGIGAAAKEVLTSLKLTALLEATGVVFVGSGSGSTTLQANAAASGTLTLPAATDTLVGRNTTDTLSNKTLATPTITTNATVPVVIGGTGTTSALLLRPTSGVGTTGADIVFQVGNNGATEAARILNNGNFGIANATPQAFLTVGSYSSGTGEATTRGYIQIQDPTESTTIDGSRGLELKTSPSGSGFGWKIGAVSATNLVIGNRANAATFTERVRIDSSGNVGIGITPSNKLHVNGVVQIDQVAGAADLYMGSGTTGNSGKITYDNNNNRLLFSIGGSEKIRIESVGNVKVGGTADRATTAGTNQVVIFNGTAPVGTLANGCSFYSTAGEMRVMDAAGNATLISPHDNATNQWIYDSVHTPTGKRLRIDVERLLRRLNDELGMDCVHEVEE